jgi:hypothetical protein
MFIQQSTLKILSPLVYGLEDNFITGSCYFFVTNKHFCRFYTCIQNQIIHKHIHVNYNPLKHILELISSLKLSTVHYAAVAQSRCHSRTTWLYISMSNCFPSFIVRWILNFVDQPTHENWYTTNKSDFTVIKYEKLGRTVLDT